VHRSRTGPDRPGPKTEFGEGCGPRIGPGNSRIGPNRSRIGLLLSNSAALQTCTRDLARPCPSIFWARSARAAFIREKKICSNLVHTEDRIQQNHGLQIGPKRTGPVRSELVLGPVQSRTENCRGLCGRIKVKYFPLFPFVSRLAEKPIFV